ncbi:hypothetical protein Pelo_9719 [Pelomyxa schiedti]|nr:hypothetical protein Pelo_9719 [Pelomyxa schiedti]
MAHQPSLELSFVCPKCVSKGLQYGPEARSTLSEHGYSYLSHRTIMEAVDDNQEVIICPRDHQVAIAEVAPGDFFNPSVININSGSGNKKNSVELEQHGITTPINTGYEQPTVTPHSTVLYTDSADPDSAKHALELLLPEVNTLKNVPDHPNVTKFYGLALRSDKSALLGMNEHLRPLSLPPELFPAAVTSSLTITSPCNEVLSLAQLLKVLFCYNPLQPQDEILPMCLREHILRDVARGLSHLHRQYPSVVHGDVQVGNVLITSLDPTGSSPWAKITVGMIPADYNTLKDEVTTLTLTSGSVQTGTNMSPEAIIQGDTFPTTQGDVWNFGILVHNVVAPLSFVNLKSKTSSSRNPKTSSGTQRKAIPVESAAPVPELSVLKCTTARSRPFDTETTGKNPVELSAAGEPQHNYNNYSGIIEVERYQVAPALSTGQFFVDTDTMTTSTTTDAAGGKQKAWQRVILPLWARQVISCCLVADPSFRSPIETIINIWDHF